jgi:hypothetical protein
MRPLLLILALLSSAATAQTSPILIPLFFNGPGANGAQWYTRVQVTNRGPEHLPGGGVQFLTICSANPLGCHEDRARRGTFAMVEGPETVTGLLLHADAAHADAIDVQAQFGEEQRHPGALGIELPVARERDFRTTPFGFPVVNIQPPYRALLRLYSPDPIQGQRVRVIARLWSIPTSSFVESWDLTLVVQDTSPTPLRPAFAQLDLTALNQETALQAVRVDVIPLETDGHTPRIWGFVTITSNDNDVRVMRP